MKPKTKTTPPKDTNPIQSEKFREAVRDLEAAGELNLIEADDALSYVVLNAIKPRD